MAEFERKTSNNLLPPLLFRSEVNSIGGAAHAIVRRIKGTGLKETEEHK